MANYYNYVALLLCIQIWNNFTNTSSTNPLAQEAISLESQDIVKDKPDKATSGETNSIPEDSAPPVERVAIDIPPRPSLSDLRNHV